MKLVQELTGYFVLQGLDVEGLKGDCIVQARHVSYVVLRLVLNKSAIVQKTGHVFS
jgi:hypothetical protein